MCWKQKFQLRKFVFVRSPNDDGNQICSISVIFYVKLQNWLKVHLIALRLRKSSAGDAGL